MSPMKWTRKRRGMSLRRHESLTAHIRTRSSPLAIHDSRSLVHDSREEVDIFIEPSVLAKLAMIGGVVRVGCKSISKCRLKWLWGVSTHD